MRETDKEMVETTFRVDSCFMQVLTGQPRKFDRDEQLSLRTHIRKLSFTRESGKLTVSYLLENWASAFVNLLGPEGLWFYINDEPVLLRVWEDQFWKNLSEVIGTISFEKSWSLALSNKNTFAFQTQVDELIELVRMALPGKVQRAENIGILLLAENQKRLGRKEGFRSFTERVLLVEIFSEICNSIHEKLSGPNIPLQALHRKDFPEPDYLWWLSLFDRWITQETIGYSDGDFLERILLKHKTKLKVHGIRDIKIGLGIKE